MKFTGEVAMKFTGEAGKLTGKVGIDIIFYALF